jgi:hypothetical protein
MREERNAQLIHLRCPPTLLQPRYIRRVDHRARWVLDEECKAGVDDVRLGELTDFGEDDLRGESAREERGRTRKAKRERVERVVRSEEDEKDKVSGTAGRWRRKGKTNLFLTSESRGNVEVLDSREHRALLRERKSEHEKLSRGERREGEDKDEHA